MSQEALRIILGKEGSADPGEIVFLCHNGADKAFHPQADTFDMEFGTKFLLGPTGD
jgi:hypothetical protein